MFGCLVHCDSFTLLLRCGDGIYRLARDSLLQLSGEVKFIRYRQTKVRRPKVNIAGSPVAIERNRIINQLDTTSSYFCALLETVRNNND